MADHYTAVNDALKAFGGEAGYGAWTITTYERDASRAWYFGLSHGYVGYPNKSNPKHVRAVRAI